MTKEYTSTGYTETTSTRWGSEEKTMHMHWGVLLDQNEPTTGVYGGNQLDWDGMPYDWIDLDCERWTEEAAQEFGEDTAEYYQACDYMESGETLLYGSWMKDVDGQYMPDKNSDDDEDFAAIYNANVNTLQVVWSRTVRYGVLASPCYPGQVSADETDPETAQGQHDQAYYALPDGCIYTEAQRQQDYVFVQFIKREQELAKEDAEGQSEV